MDLFSGPLFLIAASHLACFFIVHVGKPEIAANIQGDIYISKILKTYKNGSVIFFLSEHVHNNKYVLDLGGSDGIENGYYRCKNQRAGSG